MSNHTVYAFIDGNGQYFYIGKTCNMRVRKTAHLREINNGNTLPKYNKMRQLINGGYDFNNLIVTLENNLTCEEADTKEINYIRQFREEGHRLKNLTHGGDGGIQSIPGIREKTRQALLGLKRSDETKKKVSEARKGKKLSAEHRKNLSIAAKKRRATQETKDKQSLRSKGKVNIKKYELIDPNGNVYITESGLAMFCEQHGLGRGNMVNVVCGKLPHHKGWRGKKLE